MMETTEGVIIERVVEDAADTFQDIKEEVITYMG
jgi:hypothetical protein